MRRTSPRYVTVGEAADELKISDRTVRRWVAAGRLPAWRVGERGIRLRRDDVDALMRRIPTA